VRSSLAARRASKLDSILGWARGIGALTVIGNVSSLSATALVTSGLGFVFWSVSARTAPPAAVGLAAAAISASTLLGTISLLGLGTLLIGEIAADGPRQGSLLATSLLVVGVAGSLCGLVFALLGPAFVQQLQPLRAGWLSLGLFVIAAGGIAVGLLVDQLMIGQLRGELQLARNTLYALTKLGLLIGVIPLMVGDQGVLIFATWPLGNLLSLLALGAFLVWRPIGLQLARPDFSLLRRLGGRALGHHALNLSLQAPSLALPLLVTILLSTTANAYFYTAWMIASVAFLPQTALAVTLFAIGAREPAALVSRVRLTLVLGLAGGLAAIVVTLFAADWLLGVFGGRYAAEASSTLRILVLAVIPIVVKTHFVALARVRRQVGAASIAVATGAGVELIAAVIGARLDGLPGLSLGWLLGMCVEAAYMAPPVWRTARPELRWFARAGGALPHG
jgi:O-antigen/teichoic acid export membrane protein